jgi:hypothetical protein
MVLGGMALLGLIAGYMLCVIPLCSSASAGNLCGLPAAFICGPGGLIAGVVAGIAMLSRSRKARQDGRGRAH